MLPKHGRWAGLQHQAASSFLRRVSSKWLVLPPARVPLGGGARVWALRARLRAAVAVVVSVGLTGLEEMGLNRRSALRKGGGSVCFDLSGQVDFYSPNKETRTHLQVHVGARTFSHVSCVFLLSLFCSHVAYWHLDIPRGMNSALHI